MSCQRTLLLLLLLLQLLPLLLGLLLLLLALGLREGLPESCCRPLQAPLSASSQLEAAALLSRGSQCPAASCACCWQVLWLLQLLTAQLPPPLCPLRLPLCPQCWAAGC